jgi:alkylation response protein AidB-like acyl-CoA dehydrogenase
VTVRPIRQLGGETGFAEIFLDGAFVPDADVVGAPGDGWRIAMSTAGHEQGLSLRSPGRFSAAATRLVELWRRAGDPADTALRDRVADAWIGAQAYRLHTFATAARLGAGGTLGAEASLGKVLWSELDVALHETALDLLGPQAELAGRPGPDGHWLGGYLFSLAGPIYAGTNEIQRTLIAERLLGWPDERGHMITGRSAEQEQFAASLHGLLAAADVSVNGVPGGGASGGGPAADRERDVSAAKVACTDAARLAARGALQVHGAIGYTQELDLHLWLTKVRALAGAWGSQSEHRARVMAAVAAGGGLAWS